MSALLSIPEYTYDSSWFPDSGAEYNGPEQLHMGNGKDLPIKKIGYTTIQSNFNPSVSLTLQNLLHVPDITKNLISVSKFA